MPGPPPALTSNLTLKDYNEVLEVGAATSAARPADRRTSRGSRRPLRLPVEPGGRQVASARGDTLSENARALALINMASSDALVTRS